MRNGALVRVLCGLRRLEAARVGVTLDELAAEARVSTRTIRRDLEALEAAGVPLAQDDERRWRVFDWRSELA